MTLRVIGKRDVYRSLLGATFVQPAYRGTVLCDSEP